MGHFFKLQDSGDNVITGTVDTAASKNLLDVILGSGSKTSIEGTEFFSGSTIFQAKVTKDGELATTETERERNVMVSMGDLNVNSKIYYAMVDLSDTTNFPHDQTGRIDVSYVDVEVDKSAQAAGGMFLGVITSINTTSSAISYLWGLVFEKNSTTRISKVSSYAPSQLKFGVTSGALSFALVQFIEPSVTAVNLTSSLTSPRGTSTVTPAVGDLIMKADFNIDKGGSWNWNGTLLYHGEA